MFLFLLIKRRAKCGSGLQPTQLWRTPLHPSNFRLKDHSHACRNRLRPPCSGGPALHYSELRRRKSARRHAVRRRTLPSFSYGSNTLVVLACFRDGAITHIADGRKGMSAGTGLARLNMTELQRLERPLPFEELVGLVPARFRAPFVGTGGLLPPKTFAAAVDALTARDPNLAARLARFSENRARAIPGLRWKERENLAVQKESLGLALAIAGVPRAEMLSWSPTPGRPASFLEGLPGARVREDVMIIKDFTSLPGFNAIRDASKVAAMIFVNPTDRRQALTVIMANRTPLEEQTGVDLICYNETYGAFVLVQYKAMEQAKDGPEFHWRDGDQFTQEIQRMDVLLAELAKCGADRAPEGYRLCNNPFFLKVRASCSIRTTRACSRESIFRLTVGRACIRTDGSRGRRAATLLGSTMSDDGSPTLNSSRSSPTPGLARPSCSLPNLKKLSGRFSKPGEP